MTWMLQVRQNKGTECNKMRNFSLNVIVVTSGWVTRVKRNKEQTALMDNCNHLPHLTARCFLCDIRSNLTYSTDIKIMEIESEVFWPVSVSSWKLKSTINPILDLALGLIVILDPFIGVAPICVVMSEMYSGEIRWVCRHWCHWDAEESCLQPHSSTLREHGRIKLHAKQYSAVTYHTTLLLASGLFILLVPMMGVALIYMVMGEMCGTGVKWDEYVDSGVSTVWEHGKVKSRAKG